MATGMRDPWEKPPAARSRKVQREREEAGGHRLEIELTSHSIKCARKRPAPHARRRCDTDDYRSVIRNLESRGAVISCSPSRVPESSGHVCPHSFNRAAPDLVSEQSAVRRTAQRCAQIAKGFPRPVGTSSKTPPAVTTTGSTVFGPALLPLFAWFRQCFVRHLNLHFMAIDVGHVVDRRRTPSSHAHTGPE